MKQVPEGSEPVGASCPTCKGDLVAPPDTDGVAWCLNEECPEVSFGFVRRLVLVMPMKRGEPSGPIDSVPFGPPEVPREEPVPPSIEEDDPFGD